MLLKLLPVLIYVTATINNHSVVNLIRLNKKKEKYDADLFCFYSCSLETPSVHFKYVTKPIAINVFLIRSCRPCVRCSE